MRGSIPRFPEQLRFRAGLIETLHEYTRLLAEPMGSEQYGGSIGRAVELSENLIQAE